MIQKHSFDLILQVSLDFNACILVFQPTSRHDIGSPRKSTLQSDLQGATDLQGAADPLKSERTLIQVGYLVHSVFPLFKLVFGFGACCLLLSHVPVPAA